MRKIIINILEIYIYLFIGIAVISLFSMSNFLGMNSWMFVIMFLLLVPLIFGMIIIQIDNNSLLRDIKDVLTTQLQHTEEKKLNPKQLTEEDVLEIIKSSEGKNNVKSGKSDDETTKEQAEKEATELAARLKKLNDEAVRNFDSKLKK